MQNLFRDLRISWSDLLPRTQHLRRLRRFSVMIDADEYNGGKRLLKLYSYVDYCLLVLTICQTLEGSTCADALAAGVPVMTTAGETATSRMASSYLLAVGRKAKLSRILCNEEQLMAAAIAVIKEYKRAHLSPLASERLALRENLCESALFDPSRWVEGFLRSLRCSVDAHFSDERRKFHIVAVF